jgi:IS605 OrfB family transposase
MLIYRSVKQRFEPDARTRELMKTFTLMVDDCIRLGFANGKSSFQEMKRFCYPRMMQYDVDSSYRTSAIFEASNLLKKYETDSKRRQVSRPYCRRPFASASVNVHVWGCDLVLPGDLRIPLHSHTLGVLSQPGVRENSATITPTSVGIVYSMEVKPARATGVVALDVNLDNVTTFDTAGRTKVFDLKEVVRAYQLYRRITSRFRRNDRRIKREVFRKHAKLAHDRTEAVLHRISHSIIYDAKAHDYAIAFEDIKGIREMFSAESKSSSHYLFEMNTWPFRMLLKQVEYKAKREGLPVLEVAPEGTSSTCSACGGAMTEVPWDRRLTCKNCNLVIDRDENGARNILARALRSWADGTANEAMVGRVSGRTETASKVDAANSRGQNE